MVLRKLKPDMTVWDVRKNIHLSFESHYKWSVWPVQILKIDEEKEMVYASWNVLNKPKWYSKNIWSKWRLKCPEE